MRCLEVQLSEIPDGAVTAQNFVVVEAKTDEPESGQVLVGLRRLGLNAGLAHRLGGQGTAYGPGIGIGDVPGSDTVVEVVESEDEGFKPGDLAVGKMAWRTAAVVYVSGAAGGVGSCVVQFAKARSATVIGVAGSAEKVALLTDTLGADRAINRHDGSALDLLREAAPNGIDLYYDNVGGDQLEAALDVLNHGGRAVICGAVSGGSDAGPANYRNLISQELTMRGFTVTAHEDLRDQFEKAVTGWLQEGKVQSLHTVFDGIERVPEAFESLLSGGSSGRVLVSVPPPSAKS